MHTTMCTPSADASGAGVQGEEARAAKSALIRRAHAPRPCVALLPSRDGEGQRVECTDTGLRQRIRVVAQGTYAISTLALLERNGEQLWADVERIEGTPPRPRRGRPPGGRA